MAGKPGQAERTLASDHSESTGALSPASLQRSSSGASSQSGCLALVVLSAAQQPPFTNDRALEDMKFLIFRNFLGCLSRADPSHQLFLLAINM